MFYFWAVITFTNLVIFTASLAKGDKLGIFLGAISLPSSAWLAMNA